MDAILKLWEFFNGRKTAIGLVLVFLAQVLPQVQDLLLGLGVNVTWVGEVIVLLGALHKVWKKA